MTQKLLSIAAIVALVAAAPALAATFSASFPVEFLEEIPCADGGNGELALVSGNLHVVIGTTSDGAGGFHVHEHFQPQGITAEGLTTGDVYRGTGVTRENFSIGAEGLPFTNTFESIFQLIGPGPGNNLRLRVIAHLTVDNQGEVTAEFVRPTAICD